MTFAEKTAEILKAQKELLDSLEREVHELSESDIIKENSTLAAKLEKSQEQRIAAQKELEEAKRRLENTQRALQETMLREKMDVLFSIDKRIKDYFIKRAGETENRLVEFEQSFRRQIEETELEIQSYNDEGLSEVKEKLNETKMLFESKLSELRAQGSLKRESIKSENSKKYAALRNEAITKEETENNLKKKSFESFIGLNLLNKVGILLIIVGTIAVGQFAFTKISNEIKSILIFAFGIFLLIIGELISRKSHNNIFSQGILSGGVAVLFADVAISFFWLKLFPVLPAFFACVVITLLAFFLSLYHKSQPISAFAIIGGYMPVIAFFIDGAENFLNSINSLRLTVAYFAILCIFALFISLYKNWKVTQITGFILNVAAISGVYFTCQSLYMFYGIKNLAPNIIGFAFLSFLAYTIIPVIGKKGKLRLDIISLCIMTTNMVFSYLILFSTFDIFFIFKNEYIKGIIQTVFTFTYALITWYSYKHAITNKKINGALFIISFGLSMLIVPSTLGEEYLPLSWVIESSVLTFFGISMKQRFYTNTGLIAYTVALLASVSTYLDPYKFADYTTLVLIFISMYTILILAARFNLMEKATFRIINVAAMINTCAFGNVIFNSIYSLFDYKYSNSWILDYGIVVSSTIVLSAVAIITPLFKRLCKKEMFIVSYIITIAAFILYATGNVENCFCVLNPFTISYNNPFLLINLIATIIAFIGVISSVYSMFRSLAVVFHSKIQAVPIAVLAATVFQITLLLVKQFDMSFDSAWISMVYLGLAIIWILIGFVKRFRFTRLTGLAMTFLSLGKLFILDLADLNKYNRIISFFVFGGLLLGISFVYQYFNRQLESMNKGN
jgi:hypothetical protein